MWSQHIMACRDAAEIGVVTDPHDDCTLILCEATGEPGWTDGAVAWVSHARSETAAVDPGEPADTRMNPSLGDAHDWR